MGDDEPFLIDFGSPVENIGVSTPEDHWNSPSFSPRTPENAFPQADLQPSPRSPDPFSIFTISPKRFPSKGAELPQLVSQPLNSLFRKVVNRQRSSSLRRPAKADHNGLRVRSSSADARKRFSENGNISVVSAAFPSALDEEGLGQFGLRPPSQKVYDQHEYSGYEALWGISNESSESGVFGEFEVPHVMRRESIDTTGPSPYAQRPRPRAVSMLDSKTFPVLDPIRGYDQIRYTRAAFSDSSSIPSSTSLFSNAVTPQNPSVKATKPANTKIQANREDASLIAFSDPVLPPQSPVPTPSEYSQESIQNLGVLHEFLFPGLVENPKDGSWRSDTPTVVPEDLCELPFTAPGTVEKAEGAVRTRPVMFSDSPKDHGKSLHKLLAERKEYDLTEYIHHVHSVSVDSGGQADVFKGSLKDGKEVAIKRFRKTCPKGVKAIVRELRIASNLNHENVLEFLGYILENDRPSCVTPWMRNGSLREHLTRLDSKIDVRFMSLGIARGLEYLHSKNVIHGDLKSDNVLLSDEGRPLLMDFGISHFTESLSTHETATDAAKGSIRYMAIELLQDDIEEEPTPRHHTTQSDVWAYGMLVQVILTKEEPYHLHNDWFRIFKSIRAGRLPKHPDLDNPHWDTLSEVMWLTCEKCWKRDPGQRPSMKGMRKLLEGLRITFG